MSEKMKTIILLILGVFIGFTFFGILISIYFGSITKTSYGLLEWMYYTTQVVGVIATLVAVCCALFGKEIRDIIIKERCSVELVNGGFYENLGPNANQSNPIANSYDCCLKITNNGDREISKCELLLRKVQYVEHSGDNFLELFSSDYKPLYWHIPGRTEISLLVGVSQSVPLFKIYPEDSRQTPDAALKSPLCMRVIGCQVKEIYTKQGVWKCFYEIRSQSKVLTKFDVVAKWNGEWCNRSTEMNKCVSAILKTT
jgi:hypothetical protein